MRMSNEQDRYGSVMLSAAKNLFLAGDRLGRSFLRCAQHDILNFDMYG